MDNLHSWQLKAIELFMGSSNQVASCVACPGAGKTRMALALTRRLKNAGKVNALVVTVHTVVLRSQWQTAAAAQGLELSNNLNQPGRDGAVITHHQLTQPSARIQATSLCKRRKVLLCSDEHHHLAESRAWGESMEVAYGGVKRILLLSGTLFRHDEGIIPFIGYDEDGISQPDYEYPYQQALQDRIVAPIHFPIYGGQAEWRHGTAGSIANFGDELSLPQQNRQLNTAIASQDWLEVVLQEADERLALLQQSHPQAGGLTVAKDQAHGRYLAKLLEKITGTEPVLAISDEPQAQQRIMDFAREDCRNRWIVAVKMISEGIDIPRLRVGVYATNILTELFFRQLAGRLIRLAPGLPWKAPVYLYLPGHPALLEYARDYAEQRRHVLGQSNDPRSRLGGERELFEPISASALPLGSIAAGTLPGNGTALEHLDWALLRLDGLIGEGILIKEGLLELRKTLASAPMAQEPSHVSTGLDKPDQDVLAVIARHRTVSGLTVDHLQVLCQSSAKQVAESVVDLRLEGLIEGMTLTDRGKERLGAAMPPALESTADVLSLWLKVLPEYETRLLRALFACDRNLTLDQWAKGAEFRSLSEGKPYKARQNLIELGLVAATKISSNKAFSIHSFLTKNPPSYEKPQSI